MDRKESQKDIILEYLKRNDGISAIEALNLCGCFRLASIICILRGEGWNIKTTLIGEGNKKYAWYTLEKGEEKRW